MEQQLRRLDGVRLGDHLALLHRSARTLCGSREQAEDLVQETCARVLARPAEPGDDRPAVDAGADAEATRLLEQAGNEALAVDPAAAAGWLARALELRPAADTQAVLAVALGATGRIPDARAVLDAAHPRHPAVVAAAAGWSA